MSWDGKVYVTASNPAPGQLRTIEGDPDHQLTDLGLGVNTYIAGGSGPGGAVPVTFSGTIPSGVYLQDTGSNPILVTTDGQRSLAVSDESIFNVLDKILKELKRTNVYLSTMTDMELDNEDIH